MNFTTHGQITAAVTGSNVRDLSGAGNSTLTEFDLFRFENEARKELDRIGPQNAKLIEKLRGIDGCASMLVMKMERNPEIIKQELHMQFSKKLESIFNMISDLEADYLEY